MNILDAVRDPQIFGPWFRNSESWQAWTSFLAALFGLPLDDAGLETFRKHTGRSTPAPNGYLDATLVIGRRGGKSLVMALIAAYLAAFVDWRPYLTGGESGAIIIVAADRRQAAVTLGYLREMLAIPLLRGMVTRETNELIELNTGITVEVVTASFKTIRGRTVCCAIADELAFWPTDDSASPDSEIIAAIKPAMATVPGARLLKASSPYARRGVLYADFAKHYGKDSPTLVWKAATRDMNPSVPEAFIAAAYEEDPASAAAEYGGEFRTDIESFVSRDVVENCIIPNRYELPPVVGPVYYAFVDPSGGSSDSMTLAIAHRDGERTVIDAIREARPPFSPESVVAEFCTLLKSYRISTVTGDRYGGEWPRERFQAHGITYQTASAPKSDLYRDSLSFLNSARVELLDSPKLKSQLLGLERRTARSGRDSIDHGPGAHDDIANCVAGAICGTAMQQGGPDGWREFYRRLNEEPWRFVRGNADLDPTRPSGPDFGFAIQPPEFVKLNVPPGPIAAEGGLHVHGRWHGFRHFGTAAIVEVARADALELLARPAWRACNEDHELLRKDAA
jgi:hypothetical protein